MTKWLTLKYIAEQAKISDLAAAKCSLEHWLQIRDASPEELKKAINNHQIWFNNSYCALCLRVIKQEHPCLLRGEVCIGFCVNEYRRATNSINDYISRCMSRDDFLAAVQPLIDKLQKIVDKYQKLNVQKP